MRTSKDADRELRHRLSPLYYPPLALNSLAHMVAVVVHAQHPAVDCEKRPVEAQRHRAVEVLPLLLGHLKDDFGGVVDTSTLDTEPVHPKGVDRPKAAWFRGVRRRSTLTYWSMLLIRRSISSLDHMPCFHL